MKLGQLYTIEANEKTSVNPKYPSALIQASQDQKQTNTGALVQLLIKIGAKVMVTVNTDRHDLLINSQIGIIRRTELVEGSVL